MEKKFCDSKESSAGKAIWKRGERAVSMILIDSSVWIYFFNGTEESAVSALEKLIADELDLRKTYHQAFINLMRAPVQSIGCPQVSPPDRR